MKSYFFINIMTYTVGWFICVLCGANQWSWPPIFYTFFVVVFQFLYLKKRHFIVYYQDLILLGFGVFLGFVMETFFLSFGLLDYATENIIATVFPPGWILSLYFLFTMTYNHSLKYLSNKPIYLALLGAVGGPLSYFAGSKFGAVNILMVAAFPILSISWALYLFVMGTVNLRLHDVVNRVFDPVILNKPLTVFFDPICPICSKELIYLKGRKQTGSVNYFEMTTRKEFEEKIKEISFIEAMKEIHGLDDKGRVYRGIDVFVELYPRVNLPLVAIILKSPGVNSMAKLAYKIWAHYRLANRCKIQPLD